MKNRMIRLGILLLMPVLAAIFSCSDSRSTVKWHPVDVETMPICSDCHTDEYETFDHTADFYSRHKFYAAQQVQSCVACHRESFCADCHANKEEIKPSDKFKDSPEMVFPHPGDYLSQHMIDGKINPAICFKCHGRKNNERCITCHK